MDHVHGTLDDPFRGHYPFRAWTIQGFQGGSHLDETLDFL